MKRIDRTDFHVSIVVRPDNLGDLFPGFDAQIVSGTFALKIAPKRLGDFGMWRLPDDQVTKDVPTAYQRVCDELLATLLKKRHVVTGQVTCTETALCSHCGLLWEELTPTTARDYPEFVEQPGDERGLPLCCHTAADEWRAEQAAKATAVDVEAGETP